MVSIAQVSYLAYNIHGYLESHPKAIKLFHLRTCNDDTHTSSSEYLVPKPANDNLELKSIYH